MPWECVLREERRFSEGRKLAKRIVASEAGQRGASGIKAFAADNRGCVDLKALGGVRVRG